MRKSLFAVVAGAAVAVGAAVAGCGGGSSPFENAPRTPLAGMQVNWTDVWVAGANDVWAIGNGQLFHYDGSGWTLAALPEAQRGVIALWGASPTQIWAVGSDRIYTYNGTSWTVQTAPSTGGDLATIHGSSPTDIWAVGDNGAAVHFDGAAWTRRGIGGSFSETVWVAGPMDAWLAGTFDFKKWNGASWVDLDSETDHYRAVGIWGFSKNDLWVSGEDNAFIHSNGSTWTRYEFDDEVFEEYADLWGPAPNDIWAVGGRGFIRHWNGTDWDRVSSGTDQPLYEVHGGGGEVWICGYNTLLRLSK